MKRILVAHDGSKFSDKALKKAIDIASKFDSTVTVITVAPELYLTDLLEVDRKRIHETLIREAETVMRNVKKRAKGAKPVKTVIKRGNPAEEIIDTAKKMKADLIITGSYGRHGAQKFLLGSVSSKIVDHAECSVLVVKK